MTPQQIERDREFSERVNAASREYLPTTLKDEHPVSRYAGFRDTLLGRRRLAIDSKIRMSEHEAYNRGKLDAEIWLQTNNLETPQ